MTQDVLPILDGRVAPPPEARTLRAGPLSVVFESGDLRYVRLGDREVVRRIYVAVRDRNWGTVPARLADVTIEEQPDRFLIRYAGRACGRPYQFRLEGHDRGRRRRIAAVRDGRRGALDVPAEPDRLLRPPSRSASARGPAAA